MNTTNFQQLETTVARLRNGDDSAREELLQLSYERLKKLARKMLKQYPAVGRWEQTDDVFQRAAMRLWQSLETVNPTNSRHFFNLAALQIRRELIDMARSFGGTHGLAKNQESIDPNTSASNLPDKREPASETHEASGLAAWSDFHNAVNLLDDEHRETFEMIWYHGLSQETVAEMLEVSQRTISRRWQKSRRTIFDLLGGQLPD